MCDGGLHSAAVINAVMGRMHTSLCVVLTLSPRLLGFSLGNLASSHHPKVV